MSGNLCINEMSVNPAYPLPGTIRNSMLFGEHVCPVECTAKLLLFIGVSTILLYIPLGRFSSCDLNSPVTIWDEHISPMCCICDIYQTIVYLVKAIKEAYEHTVAFVVYTLYEGKLKFYKLLGTLDNKDLCRAACCDDMESRCRCPKHKPYKHKRS